LQKAQIRTELNSQNQTLSAKIREAQLEKIPYMLILGEKKVKNKPSLSEPGKKKPWRHAARRLYAKNYHRS